MRSRTYLACPKCGQKGDQPPGLRLVRNRGAEAAHFAADDSIVALEWVECRACNYAFPVAAGSVTVVRP